MKILGGVAAVLIAYWFAPSLGILLTLALALITLGFWADNRSTHVSVSTRNQHKTQGNIWQANNGGTALAGVVLPSSAHNDAPSSVNRCGSTSDDFISSNSESCDSGGHDASAGNVG